MDYSSITEELLSVSNYRQFLAKIFSYLKTRSSGFSYGSFAQKAGFSSRNYLRDIMNGDKRMTVAAFPKICRGLKISGEWKKYLALLSAIDEQEMNPENWSKDKILQKLEKSKGRIQKKVITGPEPKNLKFFESSNWLPIYAALGSVERGSSLHEIEKRTGISRATCQQVLEELYAHNVIRWDKSTDRFFPSTLHYVFNEMGKDKFFKRSFLRTSKRVSEAAERTFENDDRLFFSSVFSVDRAKLPEFKIQLRELLLSFVDSVEDDQGTTVAELAVGLLPTH
jgi:uncharacterized protein (TIGR02147 family)